MNKELVPLERLADLIWEAAAVELNCSVEAAVRALPGAEIRYRAPTKDPNWDAQGGIANPAALQAFQRAINRVQERYDALPRPITPDWLLRELERRTFVDGPPAASVTLGIRENDSSTPNWIAATPNLPDTALKRAESAIIDLRKSCPIVDWSKGAARTYGDGPRVAFRTTAGAAD